MPPAQHSSPPDARAVRRFLLDWQRELCGALEREDGDGAFSTDTWERGLDGGGGITRVIANGAAFEKGGVNFSHVRGDALPASGTSGREQLRDAPYEAMGVSLILHPHNPYVPTTHANLRFFCVTPRSDGQPVWWFGGGYDLTPYYGFEEDCRHWHQTARDACAPYGSDVYPRCKQWCDEYFHIPHRNEARGVGGLFFDDWNPWPFERCLSFFRSVANSFAPAYLPILSRRRELAYGERERAFQLYRRGRYVEFNLVYDRGTRFGLQSGGRIESILMSLPPVARWTYDYQPQEGSPEEKLLRDFLKPRDWLDQG